MTAAERAKRAADLAARINALADDKIIDRIVVLVTLLQERQKAAEGWPTMQRGGGTAG